MEWRNKVSHMQACCTASRLCVSQLCCSPANLWVGRSVCAVLVAHNSVVCVRSVLCCAVLQVVVHVQFTEGAHTGQSKRKWSASPLVCPTSEDIHCTCRHPLLSTSKHALWSGVSCGNKSWVIQLKETHDLVLPKHCCPALTLKGRPF